MLISNWHQAIGKFSRSPFHLPPHEDDQNSEDFLFQVILERQIRIPRHLTVRAANVLKGFLNKDPEERCDTYFHDVF